MTQTEYIQTMEDLFGHPGWKMVEEDARRQIYQLQADSLDKAVCKSWDEVNVNRGKAETLAEILMMPQVIANLKDQNDASV